MHNCSEFMRTLNQRFAEWYNDENSRSGHLWQERYKRVLVEPEAESLSLMACYIEMRARMRLSRASTQAASLSNPSAL